MELKTAYIGSCILRPLISPEKKYGLKLKVDLKWKAIYIENVRVVSLIASVQMKASFMDAFIWRLGSLKMEGS